jgi:hypothetical protein
LTPPGGTWEEDGNGGNSSSGGGGHHAGFPVLLDKFQLRYKIFYYCNAASFMASVALIVLLLNQNLYKPGIRAMRSTSAWWPGCWASWVPTLLGAPSI